MVGCPCKMPPLPPATDPLPLYWQAVAADGVSFAIPADAVREIVWQFHHHGRVMRPFVGITLSELTNSAGGEGASPLRGRRMYREVPSDPAASTSGSGTAVCLSHPTSP